ncbi:MAG: threonine-phosphate decarboxylase CobD [bacterium]
MKSSSYSHGGNHREAAKRYGLSPNEILDFSANINPWANSLGIEKIVRVNLKEIYHYPDPQCAQLINQIGQYLTVDRENILAGNGSTELIYLAARALLPRKALIFAPTFLEYERALKACGGEPKLLFLKENQRFSIGIQKIIEATEGVEAIFTCNPNNPTGTFFSKDELLELVKVTEERKITLILDESYLDFKHPGESLVKEAPKRNHLLVLRSFTKFFGVAGLRLGYGVGGRHLIEKMAGLKEPWTVNCLAQVAGAYLLRNNQRINRIREAVTKESEFLFGQLSRIEGLKPYPPQANFILVKIETKFSSSKLQEELAKRGILIRDCSNFAGLNDKFFRVAVRKREENLRLIDSLSKVI